MSDTQAQLDERLAAFEDTRVKMVSARNDFVARVAFELPERWDGLARAWIKAWPDIAQELGRDGLAKVRESLISLSPVDEAAKAFEGPWLHEDQSDRHGFVVHTMGQVTDIVGIEEALGVAVDAALPPLREAFGPRRSAQYQVKLGAELHQVLGQYKELARRYLAQEQEIKNLRRAIAQQAATSIWDDLEG